MKRPDLALILIIPALIIGVWLSRNPVVKKPPARVPSLGYKAEEKVKGADVQKDKSNTPTARLVPKKPEPAKVTPKPVTSQPVSPSADARPLFYNVVKVIDGDTLVISLNGKNETLRLMGMDTPETVDPRKPVQCFGIEASNKAKEILTGQRVKLEADPTQGERDKYHRLLRYIFLEDGTNYQDYMIRQGYAHEYTYKLPFKYQTQFKQAEAEARLNKRGLWADGVCGSEPQIVTPTAVVSQGAPIAPAPLPPLSAGVYDCSGNKYNCTDFKTHAEAQAVFDYCGGVKNDIHKLDGSDKDGLACESLP